MTRNPLDQAAATLGAAGIASVLFTLATSSNNNFVKVEGAGLLVFPVLGLCALVGGLTGRRILVRVAGATYAVAAILQLAQFGRSTNLLDGNGSTFALLLALGLGLLVVGFAPKDDRTDPPSADGNRLTTTTR
ncbi:MAG: hypothetical protein H0V07_01810 [Propionibacteriales bacterium]|nr:hypothetical protein [Propionibacteriales bacterium]